MNKNKDSLGDRMKKYEYVTRTYLTRRTPVIIRIDGKSFHTFTRGFEKPFDDVLIKSMQDTMKELCENIQGCVLGYTQSDEISLVLVDYKKINSSAWFDYNIQKCASVAASMATAYFNKFFDYNLMEYVATETMNHENSSLDSKFTQRKSSYLKASSKCAMFDARVFNIPKEEVTNCILWRQNDATRNSIEMVGHCNFSTKELHKKSCNEIQDMLFTQKGINWNDFPTHKKRGSCCIKKELENNKTGWVIDTEIPIFKNEGREYIEKLLNCE